MFKVGEKVVYITGFNLPKDSIWTVHGIHSGTCGCTFLDIGLTSMFSKHLRCRECDERTLHNMNSSKRLFTSTSFRKLSEISSELSEEILKEVLTTIPELV